MRFKTRKLIGLFTLFTDVAFMASTYGLFALLKAEFPMSIRFYPWMLCGVVIYLINSWLSVGQHSTNTILAVNCVLTVGMIAVGDLYFLNAQGITAYLFATMFFAVSALRAYWLATHKVTANQMLVYTEFAIMGFGVFLFLQQSVYPELTIYQIPLFLSVCGNLISLVCIRVLTENKTKVGGSRFQGIAMLGTFVALLGAVVLGLVMLLSEGVRNMLTTVVNGGLSGIKFIGKALEMMLLFLLSLFPKMKAGEMELLPPEEQMMAEQAVDKMKDQTGLLMVLGVLIILVLIGVIVVFFIKGKKKRTLGMTTGEEQDGDSIVIKNGLWDKVKAFFKNAYQKLYFFYQCIRYRNTPQGVLYFAQRVGSKKELPKSLSESGGAYLLRMVQVWNEKWKDNEVQQIKSLAWHLDVVFYSNEHKHIPKEELQGAKAALKRIWKS